MIHFIHRGKGGRYSQYIDATLKKINRLREIDFSSKHPVRPGYKMAVNHTGSALTVDMLKAFLARDEVTFLLGDSKGMPEEWLADADIVCSVTTLPVSHEMEAAIMSDQIEKIILKI